MNFRFRGVGDRRARRLEPKDHRDPESSLPGERLERGERGPHPEPVIVARDTNDSDRDQGFAERDHDRETIESGLQQLDRALPRSSQDPPLGRGVEHVRFR